MVDAKQGICGARGQIAARAVRSPGVAFGNAEDNHAEANGRFVIVLEEALHAAQHDARVWPQALEVGRVCGVAAHQHHSWHLRPLQGTDATEASDTDLCI